MSERTATFAEFARIAGYKRSYITQLRKDDRLILDAKGRILVDASLERLALTADPSKAGVADRWAAHRENRAAAPEPPPAEDEETDTSEDAPAEASPDDAPPSRAEASIEAGMTYQAARAIKERYHAAAAKRDYEFSMGKLLNAADAAHACANAVTILRTRLETLPDVLGPQLATMTDESKTRAFLAENLHHILEDIAREFAAIAHAPEADTHG